MVFNKVDFPAPFAPIRPMREFSWISAVMPFSTGTAPKETPTSCRDTNMLFLLKNFF